MRLVMTQGCTLLLAALLAACGGGGVEPETRQAGAASPGAAELGASAESPDERPGVVEDFTLIDHRGVAHERSRMSHAKAVVLVSHGIGCPILAQYYAELEELSKRFAPEGVEFLFLNANLQDDHASLREEAQSFSIELPILKDDTQLVAQALGIDRQAEAILFDPRDGRIAYRGLIDDRLNYGSQRAEAEERYLEDALEAFLAGEPVAVPRTLPKGCLIHFDGPVGEELSYAADVAPILVEKCVSCHRPGGIAPWSMSSYRRVRGWSSMIREVVRTRRMPPWTVDPEYGHFANDIGLSPEEAQILVRWVEAGAVRAEDEPDPLEDLELEPLGEWALGEPDLVVQVDPIELPATGLVPYQYRRKPLELEEDRWVRAVSLLPSNPRVAHHAFVFVEFPPHLKHLQPKYVQGTAGYFAVYTASHAYQVFPEGTGRFIPAGSKVRFQLHYVTTGKEEVDAPSLGLYFHDEPPERELHMTSAVDPWIEVPPETRSYQLEAERFFPEPVRLFSLTPHMHYRGRSMRYEAEYPDGRRETLLSVPRYDFNWQDTYRLEEPLLLPAGTRVRVRGEWDNSRFNPLNPDPSRTVKWGLQSEEEMFIGYMEYVEVD